MSHELRTPLNAVLGWSQALRTKEMSTEVRLGLERVERNARAQAKLIDDLLDTSRIISGKVRLDMQPVELVSVIDAALESVRPAADAKTIEIESRLDPEAGAVVGDPGRLQQIFWNVLSNAIKFTPEKGRVRLELKQAGGRVTVVVSDTGIGIEPEFLPHVFERFRQADGSTTRRYGGLGLGLALTRHLVELHGGTIRATSPGESQGATFTIALPQPQRGADRALLLAPESAPSSTGRLDVDLCGLRVLVVDDDLDARDLVARALTERRAEVQAAASAAEGFVCLQSRLPNVLVSDIAMPGEDGYSFIRKVRNLPSELGGRIPAVALSAFARPEDRAKARQAGYDVHLAKPIDADELARQVASLALRLAP
jgi:CheY-like chemotaxis protein